MVKTTVSLEYQKLKKMSDREKTTVLFFLLGYLDLAKSEALRLAVQHAERVTK